jgi:hypothetical protein
MVMSHCRREMELRCRKFKEGRGEGRKSGARMKKRREKKISKVQINSKDTRFFSPLLWGRWFGLTHEINGRALLPASGTEERGRGGERYEI